MSPTISQAIFLAERGRFKEAEQLLRQELAAEPENSYAHSLLALTLHDLNRHDEALLEAREAIRLTPTSSYAHFAHARILLNTNQLDRAMGAIREATLLNPRDSRYYEVMSLIHMRKRDWEAALKATEDGLQIDPQDVGCLNLRAMVLVQLGRKIEASHMLDAALARNPENATTHATKGWALLHSGEAHQAMTHFREALRLQPNSTWARDGIIEAMKARNILYRYLLRKRLTRLTRPAGTPRKSTRFEDLDLTTQLIWRIGLGVGILVLAELLRAMAETDVDPTPILIAPFALLAGYIFLIGSVPPFFDLLLRLDRLGRLALPREKIVASNWVGLCILVAVILLVVGLALTDHQRPFLFIASIQSLSMIVPVARIFYDDIASLRKRRLIYTIVLATLLASGLVLGLTGSSVEALYLLFTLAWIAYPFIVSRWLKQFTKSGE